MTGNQPVLAILTLPLHTQGSLQQSLLRQQLGQNYIEKGLNLNFYGFTTSIF